MEHLWGMNDHGDCMYPGSHSFSTGSSEDLFQSSDSDEDMSPERFSPHTPKSSPKSALKHRGVKTESMWSLFDEDTPVEAANTAIDSILRELTTYAKSFKCPSELDFSATTEAKPLFLIDNDKNKPFINQLRNLNGLQTKLAEIPVHGDEQLREKHQAAGGTIERTLQRMKEDQLKLYKKVVSETAKAFAHFSTTLGYCVRGIELPSELDFSTNAEKGELVLLNTGKNKPFIDQLRTFDELRTWLTGIPRHGIQQFEVKYQAARRDIEQAIQRMQAHQRKLWKDSMKATALDNLLISVNNCVSKFKYPSKLDFPTNTDNNKLVLLNTRKNQVFIGQFRELQQFRDQLVSIGTHGNEKLEKKHKEIAATIALSLQKLKKHQRKLQEHHTKVRQARGT